MPTKAEPESDVGQDNPSVVSGAKLPKRKVSICRRCKHSEETHFQGLVCTFKECDCIDFIDAPRSGFTTDALHPLHAAASDGIAYRGVHPTDNSSNRGNINLFSAITTADHHAYVSSTYNADTSLAKRRLAAFLLATRGHITPEIAKMLGVVNIQEIDSDINHVRWFLGLRLIKKLSECAEAANAGGQVFCNWARPRRLHNPYQKWETFLLYARGRSRQEIADILNFTKHGIWYRLRQVFAFLKDYYGIEPPTHRWRVPTIEQKRIAAIKLFRTTYLSITKIGAIVGLDRSHVYELHLAFRANGGTRACDAPNAVAYCKQGHAFKPVYSPYTHQKLHVEYRQCKACTVLGKDATIKRIEIARKARSEIECSVVALLGGRETPVRLIREILKTGLISGRRAGEAVGIPNGSTVPAIRRLLAIGIIQEVNQKRNRKVQFNWSFPAAAEVASLIYNNAPTERIRKKPTRSTKADVSCANGRKETDMILRLLGANVRPARVATLLIIARSRTATIEEILADPLFGQLCISVSQLRRRSNATEALRYFLNYGLLSVDDHSKRSPRFRLNSSVPNASGVKSLLMKAIAGLDSFNASTVGKGIKR